MIFTAPAAFDWVNNHNILSQLLELNVAIMKEEALQSVMMMATLPETESNCLLQLNLELKSPLLLNFGRG